MGIFEDVERDMRKEAAALRLAEENKEERGNAYLRSLMADLQHYLAQHNRPDIELSILKTTLKISQGHQWIELVYENDNAIKVVEAANPPVRRFPLRRPCNRGKFPGARRLVLRGLAG